MHSFLFGKSENGLAIEAFRFGGSGKKILILGGVHGDEVEGVAVSRALVQKFQENFSLELQVTIVPNFNIDGVLAGTRHNINGVDLNRNLPTRDWSKEAFNERYYPGEEPNSQIENQQLVQYLESEKPNFIFSLHSFSKFLLNVNGNCEPISTIVNELTGYPIEESMGYPTPGCLGTYTGLERNIPTLTYELHRGEPIKKLIEVHVPAIIKALEAYTN
ncbi:MAG: M14 family zinc carboxypeptidase [Bdellovibrionales bacterium]